MNEAQKKIALQVLLDAQTQLGYTFDARDFEALLEIDSPSPDKKRKAIHEQIRMMVSK